MFFYGKKIKTAHQFIKNIIFCIFIFFSIALNAKGDFLSDYKLHNTHKEIILKALKELNSKQKLTEKEEQRLEKYNIAKHFIEKGKEEQEKLLHLRKKFSNVSDKTLSLQKNQNKNQFSSQSKTRDQLQNKKISEIEIILNEQKDEMQKNQKILSQINKEIVEQRELPETNQTIISKNQKRILSINKILTSLKEDKSLSIPETEDKKLQLSSEIFYLESQNETLSEAVKKSDNYLELLLLQVKNLEGKITNLESFILLLQNNINEKRKAASEAIAASLEESNDYSSKSGIPRNLSGENSLLGQKLIEITERINKMTKVSQQVNSQINTIMAIRNDIDQQSSLLGKSVLLSRTLRDSLMHLPNISVDDSLPDLVTETRLQKFKFDQQKQQFSPPEKFIESIRKDSQPDKEELEEISNLIKNRLNLLDNLSDSSGKLLTLTSGLQLDQQKLRSQSKELSASLRQKLFWVTSSQPVSINWLTGFPGKLWTELKTIPWVESFQHLKSLFFQYWIIFTVVAILGMGLLAKRHMFFTWNDEITKKIGRINQDSLWLTPYAILLSSLYVLPIPFLVGIPGLIFFIAASPPLHILGISLLNAAITWGVFAFLIFIVKNSEIAARHFQWPETYCEGLASRLKRLRYLLVPLVFIVNLAERQSWELDQDVLGMMLLITATLLQSALLYSLFRHMKPFLGSRFAHILILITLPALSLIQTFLTMTGYYYTALVIQHQIIGTLLLITGLVFLQSIAIRSINIGEHRLAYQRAIKKYTSSDNENFEEPVLDLATVNQQSLRLLNATLIVAFAILFYWVWKNFAGVFNMLGSFTLWTYHYDNSVTHVYLGNVLLASVVLATTFILTRNMPGLLEITLLSRLKIPPGNSYATTTLLGYSITSIGVIVSLTILGLSWDKLQWLVAAVGLGVSIGLREVFANVLSGLIILFERPVRIGDTITIGEITGEVSQIRIRATTVLDWDNKEVIIPNATLLSEKLVNWSLSNSVIRIIIPFHVAHDSDTALVESLLLKACKEHPLIAIHPKTLATLVEYGDSALFYEVRTFISHVDHRLPVRNEINRRVTELFEENGIKIAPAKRLLLLNDPTLPSDNHS